MIDLLFMKFRYALISILFIFVLSLTASQIRLVNAVYNLNSPITGPITSPITPPVPSPTKTPTPTPTPITSPIPTPTGRPLACGRYGDINQDKVISQTDAQQILKYIVRSITFTNEQKIAADVNKDGRINILDAVLIQQYIAGKINTFPACIAPTPTPIQVVKYTVSGRVTRRITYSYKIFGKNYTYSYTIPAQNVTINTVNQKTKQFMSVKTNLNGKYKIQLEKGQYSIYVSDAAKTVFLPLNVNINLQKNISQINFQGK